MKKVLVLIVVLILIAGGVYYFISNQGTERVYEVGKNLEAGEYVLTGQKTYTVGDEETNNAGYFAVCSKKDCNKDTTSIITNDNIYGNAYVILEKGQYLLTNGVTVKKISDYKKELKEKIVVENNYMTYESFYKVGTDIKEGTYKIKGKSFSYQICSKPRCSITEDEMIKIENIYKSSEIEINLNDGEYLLITPFDGTKVTVEK